jgi:hypothetical protein
MNEKDDEILHDEIIVAAGRLATEVKPQRDLWPGIEQAITQPARPARSGWNTVWAQAAAVVLLVGGSSGLTYLAVTGDESVVSPVAMGGPALNFEPVSGSFGSQYHLGPDYLDAKRDLEARLEEELERLSPDTRNAVQSNLRAIQVAIDDINKALAVEPGNVLLQELLLRTYHEELALMQHVDGIANSTMYRGDI